MKTSWRVTLLLMLGTSLGMIGWTLVGSNRTKAPPPDPARMRAWDKIASRLRQADQKQLRSGGAAPATHQGVFRRKTAAYSRLRRRRTRMEWQMGLRQRQAVGGTTAKAHQLFMRQAFERHFFTARELQDLMQSVITAHLSDLEGQENALSGGYPGGSERTGPAGAASLVGPEKRRGVSWRIPKNARPGRAHRQPRLESHHRARSRGLDRQRHRRCRYRARCLGSGRSPRGFGGHPRHRCRFGCGDARRRCGCRLRRRRRCGLGHA